MSGIGDPRRAPMLLAHHTKELTDEFLLSVMIALAPPSLTEESQRSRLAEVKKYEYLLPLGYWYPHPFHGNKSIPVQVSFTVRQGQEFALSNGRMAGAEAIAREGTKWIGVTSSPKAMDYTQQADSVWFLDRARQAFPLFEPDFVGAHIDTKMTMGLKNGLDKFAWPVMVYGPSRIAEIGENELMGAPVWRAERLSYGGILLQVNENPFAATDEELKALAKHLGLKAPGK